MTRQTRHVRGEELPFYFENWDCWCISHTSVWGGGGCGPHCWEQAFLTTKDANWKPLLCQKCSLLLHEIKCCVFQHFFKVLLPTYLLKEEAYCQILQHFSSHFAYLLEEEAYCWILQHFFQVLLPTYLLKEEAYCRIHADHVDVHSTK